MKPHLFRVFGIWHYGVPNVPHSCRRGFVSMLGIGYTPAEAWLDWQRVQEIRP